MLKGGASIAPSYKCNAICASSAPSTDYIHLSNLFCTRHSVSGITSHVTQSYHKPVSAVTSKKRRASLMFRKDHPLSEDTKFKLMLCMLLVFCASRNIYGNYILKFFSNGFKNLPSSFFFNFENL